MADPTGQDDPLDWSTERVIEELCHKQPPTWMVGTDLKPFNDSAALEIALKENDIDGDALLNLEESNIRMDLGVTSFGQRRRLRQIILFLRRQSDKYEPEELPLELKPQLSHNSQFGRASLSSYDNILSAKAGTPNTELSTRLSHTPNLRDHSIIATPSRDSGALQNGSLKQDDKQIIGLLNGLEDHLNEELHNEPLSKTPIHEQRAASTHEYVSSGDAKRRRLAPEDISTHPLSATKTTPNGLAISGVPQLQESPTPSEQDASSHGTKHVGSKVLENYVQEAFVPGPLRTSPVSVSEGSTLLNNSDARQGMLAANVRLETNPAQETSNLNTEVAHRIATHLGSQTARNIDNVQDDGQSAAEPRGMFHSAHKHQTVINNSAKATILHMSRNPLELNSSLPPTSAEDVGTSLPGLSKAENSATSDGYQRLLEQYPVDNHEDILPLYGDSDEEDRYVTEGSISDADSQAHPSIMDQAGQLSKAEIDAVIDEAIGEFKADWIVRKLPKTQRTAHNKWMIAFKLPGTRTRMLRAARTDLDSATRRLPSFRSALHDSTWTKASDVKQLCDALSATVELIEESKYIIQVLASEQEPNRPSREAVKQAKHRHETVPAGEDNCSSDEDSLDDFLAEDGIDDQVAAHNSSDDDWNPQLAIPHHTSSSQGVIMEDLGKRQSVSENRFVDDREAVPASNAYIMEITDDDVAILSNDEATGGRAEEDKMDDIQFDLPRTPIRSKASNENPADADDESAPISSTKRTKSAKKRALNDSKKRNPIVLPHLTDSGDNTSDAESDLDRAARVPGVKYRKSGRSTVKPIDLTLSSPPTTSPTHNDFDIRTPELNAVDTKRTQHSVSGKGRLNNDEPEEMSLTAPELPDIRTTLRTTWRYIEESQEQNSILALAKSVYLLDKHDSQMLLAFIKKTNGSSDLRDILQVCITAITEEDSEPIRTHIIKKDHTAATMTTLLFVTYHCAREIMDTNEVTGGESNDAWNASKTQTAQFRNLLINLLEHWLQHFPKAVSQHEWQDSSDMTDREAGFETGLETVTDIDADEQPLRTQSRTRGRPKGSKNRRRAESPLDVQRSGKKRMAEQSRLKAALTHKLRGIMSDTGRTMVPINFKEPIVYVDGNVAPRLRPHQVDGIQFMWRELVEDPKHQGCLLAHTMGLGKTMQVITVLATIAKCNKSADPKIAAHIPQHLRDLRVLVLCPPTLIANWFEELVFWLPEHDTLGPVYRIGNTNNTPYSDVKQWSETGGVLLIAYGRLVSFCKVTATRTGATDEQHKQMSDWLLNLPKVVIADEAHMLKNPTSLTSVYANKIVTHSRVALTGSPLSNHLEEYWAMIDFIAPKYLGDKSNFQNKFVKPIELSLKEESNAYQRRIGLKKLHVLKRILAPKVHRADITALSHDLPPKTEFYITVPLTELQKKAYVLYVHHFRKIAGQETHSKGNILVWIALLSLLLNHPFCFVGKLEEDAIINAYLDAQPTATLDPQTKSLQSAGKADDDDAGLAEDVDISGDAAVQGVAEQAVQVFQEHKIGHSMDDPALSYRCLVVQRILEQTLALGEKTLIFSHSIPTLNYLVMMLNKMDCKYNRIDGSTNTRIRQKIAADFNTGVDDAMVFLISTRAGGLGLNLQGATRVIVFDYGWNPSWEEQAIGRAFRMGQKKPVFVYRIRTGGTYEDITFNTTVFKTQLFSRVVDHKSILRKGTKKANAEKYLFDPIDPEQKDFSECIGKDVVLDRVLKEVDCVRSIELTETFAQDIEETLTPEEELEANRELESEKLQLTNPAEYMRQQQRLTYNAVQASMATQGPATQKQPRAIPGMNAIVNALQQHSPLLTNAAQLGTRPDLPSTAPPRSGLNDGNRSAYNDDFHTGPAPSSSPRPSTPVQAASTVMGSANEKSATKDDNLKKLRDHKASGCQNQ